MARQKIVGQLHVYRPFSCVERVDGEIIMEGRPYALPKTKYPGIPKKFFELWPGNIAPMVTVECTAEIIEVGLTKYLRNPRSIKLVKGTEPCKAIR